MTIMKFYDSVILDSNLVQFGPKIKKFANLNENFHIGQIKYAKSNDVYNNSHDITGVSVIPLVMVAAKHLCTTTTTTRRRARWQSALGSRFMHQNNVAIVLSF